MVQMRLVPSQSRDVLAFCLVSMLVPDRSGVYSQLQPHPVTLASRFPDSEIRH